jgi:uncharacterized protein YqeY
MSLEAQVMDAMKKAMVDKDQGALRGLRAIKSAIILAKTAQGATGEVDAAQEIQILNKLIKQRKDSLTIFEQQNREDLAAKEKEEIAAIEKFLPAQMSVDEIKEVIAAIIAETGAAGAKDMGKVMGAASKKLAGKADNKSISEVVRQLLS